MTTGKCLWYDDLHMTTGKPKPRSKPKPLSDRIRREIRRRKWSNAFVSRETGLTEAGVSRFMAGEREPTGETLDRLLRMLGATVKFGPHPDFGPNRDPL